MDAFIVLMESHYMGSVNINFLLLSRLTRTCHWIHKRVLQLQILSK